MDRPHPLALASWQVSGTAAAGRDQTALQHTAVPHEARSGGLCVWGRCVLQVPEGTPGATVAFGGGMKKGGGHSGPARGSDLGVLTLGSGLQAQPSPCSGHPWWEGGLGGPGKAARTESRGCRGQRPLLKGQLLRGQTAVGESLVHWSHGESAAEPRAGSLGGECITEGPRAGPGGGAPGGGWREAVPEAWSPQQGRLWGASGQVDQGQAVGLVALGGLPHGQSSCAHVDTPRSPS